ncbi:hypothetical protein DXT99_10710 [Pontibacter diazotrophicus]|uniref:Uncharacterized protein n=1 Tax=Pontibacter diazotrophicus TaxID=1400979 RepID=A0A3D8LCW3_9BACT|nr:hypothetical protein [Pontibacter diazotrophicus]RDV15136.1 hypothetical protein DXT99_10710 [Pontibacter diazotrophicus]
MTKLKLLFLYYRSLHSFNLPFSLLVGVFCIAISENKVAGLINGFSLCLLTGGFALALYLYEQRHSQQYYFYHNQGLSRLQLAVGTLSVNLLLIFLLFLVKIYLLHG